MKKMNLAAFKNDSIQLDKLLTVHGGSGSCSQHGQTVSSASKSNSCSSDRDTEYTDSDGSNS